MSMHRIIYYKTRASVWPHLFVELLQLYLNTILIPLLDALDYPLDVHVHAS